jgi:signal transduction histidine kinase
MHHYHSFKFPYVNEKNEVFATGGVSLDITELVDSQKQLNASLETLAMNNKILDIAHSNLSPKVKFQKVVDILRALDWFKEDFSVSLYMLESETKANMVAAYSPDDQMTDYWGLRDLFSKMATTADDDLLTPKEFEKEGIYYFGIQLRTEKVHYGCLFFRTNEGYEFDEYHRLYLKAYARAIVDLIVKEQTRQEMDNQKRIMLHNAKLASIGELAAGIGHEINNPLAILKGFLETFERRNKESDFTPEEEKKYFDKIKNAANRIANIVKSLRTFSRIDDDENEEFDLKEAVEESVGMVTEIFSKEGIIIEYNNTCSESECIISGNRGRLLQVFMNLLTNARDAIETREDKNIKVDVVKQNKKVLVKVADNGTGIKDDLVDKIFDPFFTTKDVSKGTGIGLSLVYNIVSEHGGKVEVQNLDEGCEFRVELPLADT